MLDYRDMEFRQETKVILDPVGLRDRLMEILVDQPERHEALALVGEYTKLVTATHRVSAYLADDDIMTEDAQRRGMRALTEEIGKHLIVEVETKRIPFPETLRPVMATLKVCDICMNRGFDYIGRPCRLCVPERQTA